MLDKVKRALRVKTTAYDEELTDLILSALGDLEMAGVIIPDNPGEDENIRQAVIVYCKMSFGLPEDYEHLSAAYDMKKAQLRSASRYTEWVVNANV